MIFPFYSRPYIAVATSEDSYILVVSLQSPTYRSSNSRRLLYFGRVIFLFSFFQSTDFRRPWADFRETLPHDAVCPEIVYLLWRCSYVPHDKFEGLKTPIFADLQTQNRHFEPAIPYCGENREI